MLNIVGMSLSSSVAAAYRFISLRPRLSSCRRSTGLPKKSLEISFATVALRTLCEDPATAEAVYKLPVAAALRSRLADLAAAATVRDLPPLGNLREVVIGGEAGYALAIQRPYELHFTSSHVRPPRLKTGEVDWSKVSRIKILAISKHHV